MKDQFRILSKKYDPDYSGDKYRDDRMLIKLNRAYEYALNHLDEINAYLGSYGGKDKPFSQKIAERTSDSFSIQAYTDHKPEPKYRWAEYVSDSGPYRLGECVWEDIGSAEIDYVYYDRSSKFLFVLFNSSREVVYCYLDVYSEIYRNLKEADDEIKYLRDEIVPNYKCLKFKYYRGEYWDPRHIRPLDNGRFYVITRRSLATSDAPRCPWCGGRLVVRTAHRGPKAGSQFYGCSNYPACRYTREIY